MSDWTAGYVADVGYTYGYYAELNPHRVALAFLNAGLEPPHIETACELGYGQGLSINLHAAGSGIRWYGTDFNPAQAGFAQSLAAASKNQAQLFDQSFAQFSQRDDLPEFDFIGLHGIWSWISDENRHIIVDFINRKLAVGGVVYVSYNTQPGWASMVPMRELLTEHTQALTGQGQSITQRIDEALAFATKLVETDPIFLRANPQVKTRLDNMKNQNRHYLAHEYFNRDWQPMSFAKMSEWLEPAKLSYACSANYLDHIDVINLTSEQQALLNTLPEGTYRHMVRDFMVNQAFRKDYWVKGARAISPLQRAQRFRAHQVVLNQPAESVNLTVNGALGEATLSETIYRPILEQLSSHKPTSLAELEQALPNLTLSQIIQAVMVLIGKNVLSSVQSDHVKYQKTAKALNLHIARRSTSETDMQFMASSVVSGGLPIGRFDQLFILAIDNGLKQPKEWAKFLSDLLQSQGQLIVHEGKTLEDPEQSLAYLEEKAHAFKQQLPLLKALGLV